MAPPTSSKPASSRISSVIQARATDAAFAPSGAGDNDQEHDSFSAAAVIISLIVILSFVGLMWIAIIARKRIQVHRNQLRLRRARVWTIAQKERSSSSVDLKGAERASLMKERDSHSSMVVPEYLSIKPPAPPPKAHTTFGKKFHLLAGVFTSQAPAEPAPAEKQRFSQYSMLSDAGPWTRIELQSPVTQGDDNQRQPPQVHVSPPVRPTITRPASIRSHKAEISQSYQVPHWDPSLVSPSMGAFPPPPYSHNLGPEMARNMQPLPSITISPATPATPTSLRAAHGDD